MGLGLQIAGGSHIYVYPKDDHVSSNLYDPKFSG
jgi:hypothetical protein